jgi:hypothetical protein
MNLAFMYIGSSRILTDLQGSRIFRVFSAVRVGLTAGRSLVPGSNELRDHLPDRSVNPAPFEVGSDDVSEARRDLAWGPSLSQLRPKYPNSACE